MLRNIFRASLLLFVYAVVTLLIDWCLQAFLYQHFRRVYEIYNDKSIGHFNVGASAAFSVEAGTAMALWIATFAVLALRTSNKESRAMSRSKNDRRVLDAIAFMRRHFLMQWFTILAFSLLPPFVLAVVELMPAVSGKMVATSNFVVFAIVLALFANARAQLKRAVPLINGFLDRTTSKLKRWKLWLAGVGRRKERAAMHPRRLAMQRVERQVQDLSAVVTQATRLLPWSISSLAFNGGALIAIGFYPLPAFISIAVLAQIVFACGLLLMLAVDLFAD